MKFTNETLLQHYLEDLKLVDVTHGGKIKAHHPEHWNVPAISNNTTFLNLTEEYNKGRNIYFWSDIHFHHKNIIRYSGRPYPNPDLMNQCLIGNYANIIKDDDIVIWGGDITFGKIGEVNRILTQLPGYKIHIIGNHDMDHHGKLNHLIFDERHPCLVIDIIDHDIEFQFLVTHYPLDIVPHGTINIHGHIHQHLLASYNFNMCVEHTNYTPKHIKDFIDKAYGPGYCNPNISPK